jgi:hypothetical protein
MRGIIQGPIMTCSINCGGFLVNLECRYGAVRSNNGVVFRY